MHFMNIRPGDKVTYLAHAGTGRNGPEYKEKTGKALHYLCFNDHVVVGGTNNGAVVNARNFVACPAAARRTP
jgi:hypothetical protein